MNKELLTRIEAADYLDVSTNTLDRIIRDGSLPFYRIRGQIRIDKTDIDTYIQHRQYLGHGRCKRRRYHSDYADRYRRCYRGHSSAHHRHRAADDIDCWNGRAAVHRQNQQTRVALHGGRSDGVYMDTNLCRTQHQSKHNAVCVELEYGKEIHRQ